MYKDVPYLLETAAFQRENRMTHTAQDHIDTPQRRRWEKYDERSASRWVRPHRRPGTEFRGFSCRPGLTVS